MVEAWWHHAPGCPTLLVYGHYDVQPVDPLTQWASPPFDPAIRGKHLLGRGASDDKGQLFTHVKAVESLLRTTGQLPVNIVCLFEGEEEIGSPNLPPLVRRLAGRGIDVAVMSDTRMLSPQQPVLTSGLRGALSVEVEVDGPAHDLHSGTFGGAVHNPLQALCQIVAALHDDQNRVAIPGFYDAVAAWSPGAREYLACAGPSEEQFLRDAGVTKGWGERGYTSFERTTIRPALTVNGIVGGYAGPGVKAVIPSRAVAKLNLRLVPRQRPREIERLLRKHVERLTPGTVRTTVHTRLVADPAVVDRSHPAVRAAARAYRAGFGALPTFLPSGGTIPVVNLLQEQLGIPTILMGFALPDDNMHAPNEKFYLPNFENGIATSIHFLNYVADLAPRAATGRGRLTNPALVGP
jgi:acetylornithine deacetylase/succinyl-diaminopimelate desuccinylase-like protein